MQLVEAYVRPNDKLDVSNPFSSSYSVWDVHQFYNFLSQNKSTILCQNHLHYIFFCLQFMTLRYSSGANNTTTATLIGTLDALRLSGRIADGPLRIPCLDRWVAFPIFILSILYSSSYCIHHIISIVPYYCIYRYYETGTVVMGKVLTELRIYFRNQPFKHYLKSCHLLLRHRNPQLTAYSTR